MRRLVVWYILLNKRLFKKYSFLFILCMIPLLVGAVRLMAQEESGIVSIALCPNCSDDELVYTIIGQLLDDNGVLRYEVCDTEEEARKKVEKYEADAAWIFPQNLTECLRETAADKYIQPVIEVVEREDTIPLIFSREILSGVLYQYFSYEVYVDFVRDDMGLEIGDAELREVYESKQVEGNMFRLEYMDGQSDEENSYLVTPLRGMLALWLVLCGFAASMYFIQDEQRGHFSWVPMRHRLWVAFGFHGVLLSDAAIVLLVSCKLAGVFTLLPSELLCVLLFSGCTLVFCNFIRILCGTPERLGSCIPILLAVMVVLSSVFVNIKNWKPVQYLLPPYYYLKSIHSVRYLYGMLIYLGIGFVLCVLAARWRSRYDY